jgi:excinuclease ABC subunit A
VPSSSRSSSPDHIRLRGVRQNNLKGFDLDLPLGRYIVVTGLSGAGKSSLVFDTLHAEGQRRYVETFSAYTRQFLELLDKPAVDTIENIRPSIAIQQSNTVKTSRSTVGTMTELTDYAKVWFSQVARCYDPETGQPVEDDTPATIWTKARRAHPDVPCLVAFRVDRPGKLTWAEILKNLRGQAYLRVLLPGRRATDPLVAHRVDALQENEKPLTRREHMYVAQDRMSLQGRDKTRFLEAAETALHFGQGQLHLFTSSSGGEGFTAIGHYSRGLHFPATGRSFRPASPALFSFNSPLGACPQCRGFGRVIEIDYRLAIPDRSKSINQGAIKCWEGQVYGESKKDLIVFAKKRGIPLDIPFAELTPEQQAFVIDGEPGYGTNGREWPRAWYGIKGFFDWLEKNTYKMHVRVFLSRFRAYNPCPACDATRLQPEALCWKWQGYRLPDLYQLPVSDLLALIRQHPPRIDDHQSEIAHSAMVTRLSYLEQVGLGYLTLDRSSKTLSGGEVERVNLTSCLGTSLVDTLFVLDEPSIGLHPRDIDRLIAIIRNLTAAGNTVVVVEHDEAMIAAADHVIEVGPEPGAGGGRIVFQGDVPALLSSSQSITGRYLSGRARIDPPAAPRTVKPRGPHLVFKGITRHNLKRVDLRLPLNRFVCLSGVSGSGKSTLLDHAIYRGLLAHRQLATEDAADIKSIKGAEHIGEVVLVDQSPLSRTPRSNPALFCEAWDEIRTLYAREPAALSAGFSPASFSFNAGDGRCDHCQGLGYERVEMQFLSDVFVPCPICEGRRFKPEVLAITWNGHSIADLLGLSIAEAMTLFAEHPNIQSRLASLDQVGLGYLPLGQPLNTLSGGEAQRLKLVKYLGGLQRDDDQPALLLLDEPTTGLHRHDVRRLLEVLQALVDHGHSVVIIEHNLDVLKSADWLIEVGPEAGAGGGRIVATGPPQSLANHRGKTPSATAPYLAQALQGDTPCHASDDMSDALAVAEPATVSRPPSSALSIIGARENNLKDLNLTLPAKELAVVTGVSGSGKSTLAFDIVFAEGQRRFMESMSAYARQFVEQLPRPNIDHLGGIPPTVAIEQRVTRGSRKSTVATITEVSQYLRLLYARIGIQHHPETDNPVRPLSASELEQLLARVLRTAAARRSRHLYLCAPLVRGRKGHHEPIAKWIARQGYELMRSDGEVYPVNEFTKLDRYREHDVEVVVADLKHTSEHGALLRKALRLGKGSCFLLTASGKVLSWFSTTRTDLESGESFPELDPKHFSHNSPRGWCPACRGHGRVFGWMLRKDDEDLPAEIADIASDLASFEDSESTRCPECLGARLNPMVRAVKLHFKGRRQPLSLPRLLACTAAELLDHLHHIKTNTRDALILRDILPQIEERLKFLDHVGLGYLTLDRPTSTLSGGEAQRIRLAAQLGTNLAGVLYVLDEPSIGLHARDNERLITTLETLRDKGNSLLVVEHDDELMLRADRIVDLGPGAGQHGGELLAMGTPAEIRRNQASLTGLFLDRGITHPLRGSYRSLPAKSKAGNSRSAATNGEWLQLTDLHFRNLKGFDLQLPLGRLIMAVGPSGAGKSTLFRAVLRPAVEAAIKQKKNRLTGRSLLRAGGFPHAEEAVDSPPFGELRGKLPWNKVIEVDQSPIGKTPRSTPATYLGIFDLIRQFFASLPEAKIRGYNASRFSFNTAGGRCDTCKGAGRIKLEMAFMPDTYLDCEDCGGSRFGPELNDVTWNGKTIGQVLQLTFEEAAEFFSFHSKLGEVCQLMVDCGLGYLSLGQSSPTLSGGEAQRLKLITELSRGLASYTDRKRGALPRNLYLLEEPTIGLHLSDCEKLIHLLHNLVDQGHTVIVIEHQLDLIAEADYVVELGPSGGPGGGRLIHQGNLTTLLKKKRSPTAPYLQSKLPALQPNGK